MYRLHRIQNPIILQFSMAIDHRYLVIIISIYNMKFRLSFVYCENLFLKITYILAALAA
jgi:hypothetical protein